MSFVAQPMSNPDYRYANFLPTFEPGANTASTRRAPNRA